MSLLPPDMRAWLAEGHLGLLLSDVVDTLDLSAIYLAYAKNDDETERGTAASDIFSCAVWKRPQSGEALLRLGRFSSTAGVREGSGRAPLERDPTRRSLSGLFPTSS